MTPRIVVLITVGLLGLAIVLGLTAVHFGYRCDDECFAAAQSVFHIVLMSQH